MLQDLGAHYHITFLFLVADNSSPSLYLWTSHLNYVLPRRLISLSPVSRMESKGNSMYFATAPFHLDSLQYYMACMMRNIILVTQGEEFSRHVSEPCLRSHRKLWSWHRTRQLLPLIMHQAWLLTGPNLYSPSNMLITKQILIWMKMMVSKCMIVCTFVLSWHPIPAL